jgi:hypothetical protein
MRPRRRTRRRGLGAGGPLAGAVARLTSPVGALLMAAGAVAGAGVLSVRR